MTPDYRPSPATNGKVRDFWIVIQVYQVDNCLDVRETALQCIFDILCAHGFNSFEEKSDKQKANKSISNKSLIEKSKSDIEIGSDSEDIDKTIINEGDDEILCKDSDDEEDEEESGDSLVLYFSGVMEDNLRSDSESIKFITAKGVAKLFFLGRMFSPQLLSKLIIQWYDTETSEEMKQFLEAFLPIRIRIMNTRKSLKHQELIGEVLSQIGAKFQPTVPMIKKGIEDLINREYLERNSEEREVLNYLA